MERPEELIQIHLDNVSAATGTELHNEAFQLAKWIEELEGRIETRDQALRLAGESCDHRDSWLAERDAKIAELEGKCFRLTAELKRNDDFDENQSGEDGYE